MYELIRALLQYAYENRLQERYEPETLRQREESSQCAERAYAKLREECPAQISQRLEILWDELELIRSIDMETSFACGLSIGMTLARL